MKVLIAVTAPQTWRFFHGQLQFLRERGASILAISSPGPDLERLREAEGVRVSALRMERGVTLLSDIISLFRLLTLLARERPDLAHAHTPKAGFLVTLVAWMMGVRTRIYHCHGLPLQTTTGIRRLILRRMERLTCRLATEVWAVGFGLREMMARERTASSESIYVPGYGSINGIDAFDKFAPELISENDRSAVRSRLIIAPHTNVVLFVGRLTADKGLPELWTCWNALQNEVPNAVLVLAGRNDSRSPLNDELLRQFQKAPSVRMLGHVEDIRCIYSIADIIVLPSHREGLATVPVEAGAMGKPVVATAIPGIKEVISDRVTGLLVPKGDPGRLKLALATYLMNPEMRDRHGIAARRAILERYGRERVWEDTWRGYTRLAGGNQGAGAQAISAVARKT